MFKNFRTLDLAVEFYHKINALRLPRHLKDQLVRAAASIVLNLGEGASKVSVKEKLRFYGISLTSLREVQAGILLIKNIPANIGEDANKLGAHLYKLIQANKL